MPGYKFGASFNCTVGEHEIGGGGEGYVSIDYFANDLDKLYAALLASDSETKYKIVTDHILVESEADVGGEVIAVLIIDEDDDEEDEYTAAPTAAVFHLTNSPEFID